MHGPSETSPRLGRIVPLLLLLPSLLWILTDHRVWPWDQSWFGEVSADLWSTAVRDSLAAWSRLMLHAIASKPPAVVWIGQAFAPLSAVLGWEPALLLSILATQAASLVLFWVSVARLFGPGTPAGWPPGWPPGWIAATAGVLTLAASPLFIGMTNQYFAEPVQLLSVCLFLWIAVNRYAMGRLRLIAWLVLAAALGLAAKTTTPLYAFGFGLVALSGLVRRPAAEPVESRIVTAVLLAAALGMAALTVGWYVVNAEHTLRHALQSATGSVALHYGTVGDFSTKLAFWLRSLKAALLLPGAGPVAAVAVPALLVLAAWRIRSGRSAPAATPAIASSGPAMGPVVLAAVLQIVAVLTAFSLNINEESRFLLPLFPSVALLVALAVAAAGRTAGAAVAGLLALQWAVAHAMALGWIPVHADNPWLQAREVDGTRLATIERLAAATCPSSDAGRINLVGTEQPWLNAYTMSFLSARGRAQVGWRCYYTSLGYAQTDIDSAWERLQAMNINQIVMLDADLEAPGNFLNQINVPIRRRLEADQGILSKPFSDGITLFLRRQP